MSESDKPFMTRRGFFKRLFGRSEVQQACFAVQLVWDAFGHDELRRSIRALINGPGTEGVDEKRSFYKKLTSLVREAEPYYEYAFFEYTIDDEAEPTFREWITEIEAAIATEEEEVGDAVDGYHRMTNEQGYIVVTMILLFVHAHPLDGKLDLPEDELYTRAHLGTLVDSINRIDFERVVGDAAFIVPGSDDDGFSWDDFADEGWAYLKMVNS